MSKVLSTSSPKDLSLEAVRGVASIVVFVWHFFFAFDPNFIFEPSRGLIGLPIYGFFHGTAAVDLFFLLSGYVLTRRFFDTHNGHLLVLGAAKRWFRLMPLVLFSTLFSWVCYHYSLYAFENAALVTRSEWLFLGGGARFFRGRLHHRVRHNGVPRLLVLFRHVGRVQPHQIFPV